MKGTWFGYFKLLYQFLKSFPVIAFALAKCSIAPYRFYYPQMGLPTLNGTSKKA